MTHLTGLIARRAGRRAASEPARIPAGDRATYPSHEGQA